MAIGRLIAYTCYYCYCLLNNPNAPHRCPDDNAPQHLKNDPNNKQLEFINKLGPHTHLEIIEGTTSYTVTHISQKHD